MNNAEAVKKLTDWGIVVPTTMQEKGFLKFTPKKIVELIETKIKHEFGLSQARNSLELGGISTLVKRKAILENIGGLQISQSLLRQFFKETLKIDLKECFHPPILQDCSQKPSIRCLMCGYTHSSK
jgi:hypothetical protein